MVPPIILAKKGVLCGFWAPLNRGYKSPFFHETGICKAHIACMSQFNPQYCIFSCAGLCRAEDINLCHVAICAPTHSSCLDIDSSTYKETWNHVKRYGQSWPNPRVLR